MNHTDEEGILAVLLKNFEEHRLPRALDIKKKVDEGEALDEWDIEFLEEVLEEANRAKPMVDRHPELQALYARAMHLYDEITAKGLENERRS
jgi:hypothetical protein